MFDGFSPPVMGAQQMYINHFNMQPHEVKGRWNSETEREKRYLYAKLASVYDFTIPKTWPLNWFRFWLFRAGSLAVLYTKEYGWVAMPYGYEKLDLYYQPRVIQVWNQYFKDVKTGVVGLNAALLHCMDDYWGLDDLITVYAEMLANINKSFNISLMNANVSVYYPAKNKKDADVIKEAYSQATEGTPMVTVNEKLMDGKEIKPLLSSPKDNYIGQQLLEARRSVMNLFLTEIGIRNTNEEKRAQRSAVEIQQNLDETFALPEVILRNLQDGMETANRISGLGLKVRLRANYASILRREANGEAYALGDE